MKKTNLPTYICLYPDGLPIMKRGKLKRFPTLRGAERYMLLRRAAIHSGRARAVQPHDTVLAGYIQRVPNWPYIPIKLYRHDEPRRISVRRKRAQLAAPLVVSSLFEFICRAPGCKQRYQCYAENQKLADYSAGVKDWQIERERKVMRAARTIPLPPVIFCPQHRTDRD